MVAGVYPAPESLSPGTGVERAARTLLAHDTTRYDALLVERFIAGDDAAFDAVIARSVNNPATFTALATCEAQAPVREATTREFSTLEDSNHDPIRANLNGPAGRRGTLDLTSPAPENPHIALSSPL